MRPPATTGVSEDFDRIFRVQANTLEQVVMFLPALWVFALFVSPQIASVAVRRPPPAARAHSCACVGSETL